MITRKEFKKLKELIKKNYKNADCGLYNTRNTMGDTMTVLYKNGDIRLEICYYWAYFEVFGLSKEEFELLHKFYESLGGI